MPRDPPPPIEVYPRRGGRVAAPSPADVLAGGRSHPGNVAFRFLAVRYGAEHDAPTSDRAERARIAARLVAEVRRGGGRFLARAEGGGGGYDEMGDERARKSECGGARAASGGGASQRVHEAVRPSTVRSWTGSPHLHLGHGRTVASSRGGLGLCCRAHVANVASSRGGLGLGPCL